MNMWVLPGFIAFFIASLVVGIRLVLLWTRTRELPELMIGLGVLGIGPVGFGGLMAGQVLLTSARAQDPSAAVPLVSTVLFILGSATAVGGVACKLVFNWRVYHPESSVVRAIALLAIASLSALFFVRLFGDGFVPTPIPLPIANLQSTLQIAALLWGSVEALRYWRQMRRRTLIGLADPAVTNRFLLWGIGAGAAGMGTAVGTVAGLVLQRPTFEVPWIVMSSSLHGLVAAIALSLAFVPPAAYLRWVRGTSGPATA